METTSLLSPFFEARFSTSMIVGKRVGASPGGWCPLDVPEPYLDFPKEKLAAGHLPQDMRIDGFPLASVLNEYSQINKPKFRRLPIKQSA